MTKINFIIVLASAALLCGCDKQAKINSAKIELLSRNIVQFEQAQAKQMAALQTQLTSLEPMLDKMNDFYFEKNHDEAFFFHTNTLYLLLMVDKKIEAQLSVADSERTLQNAQVYGYYTNQMAALALCTAQIEDALSASEARIEDKLNAETRRVSAAANDELLKQIKLSATPDPDAAARQKAMAADVTEIKRQLEQIKVQLGQLTNPPPLHL